MAVRNMLSLLLKLHTVLCDKLCCEHVIRVYHNGKTLNMQQLVDKPVAVKLQVCGSLGTQ
jgi:hypothetical protein